ncbi:MAG TPA: transposase [Sedimentisphaerales bacterium]|nr:transposase [Sedimentisphaerales bacterium]
MRVSAGTVSDLNQKLYERIEPWRNQPITGEYPYLYLDGICLKRSWAGEVRNVSVLVAVGIGTDGFREIPGVAEGPKEDTESWRQFLTHLKGRGLMGVQLIVSDKCMGLVEAATVVEKLKALKLKKAAEKAAESVAETLTHYRFPSEHHRQIRTNSMLERIMREIRRRTRVVGAFPDGRSALMPAAATARVRVGYRRASPLLRQSSASQVFSPHHRRFPPRFRR